MALVTVFNGDPNVNDINHILDWIVDLLLPFWDGIYFTQTCSHPLGRVVRGILIPIVCDVVGAHHVSGFGSHSHKLFCTQCLLLKSDINNIDMATWPRRNLQEHQLRAQEYHKATSDEERDHIVNTYGVRWTALLRLPYWNPIAYTVIDGMHLCKGLAETHVRGVLGIEGDAKPKATLKSKFKPPAALLRSLWDGIRKAPENLSQWLDSKVNKNTTVFLCSCLPDVRTNGNKKELIEALVTWGFHNPDTPAQEPSTSSAVSSTNPPGSSVNLVVASFALSSSSVPSPVPSPAPSPAPGISSAVLDSSISNPLPEMVPQSSFDNAGYQALKRKFLEDTKPLSISSLSKYAKDLLHAEHRDTPIPHTPFSGNLLTSSIMEEVRTDIQRSILPTWIQPAPLAWGTPSGGKLSADHWKVICTIHLVVTLIRVWAYGNDGTKMPLLQNFLHLVRALQILNLRSTSKQLSEAYTSEMLQYLTTLKELFPNWEFVPNQHYSLHMGEFLQTMGPLHARDTSAFERVNHELQDTTTNRRIGQAENTMLRSYCRLGNLRLLIDNRQELHDRIGETLEVLDDIACEDHRGMFAD
ncbi:hypothetical protein F5877DRAFT_55261, partial [Lentinula edodes]